MSNLPPGCNQDQIDALIEGLSTEELAALELKQQPIRDCGHHEYDSRVEPVGGKEMCRYCWAKAKWPGYNLCSCGRQFRYESVSCDLCRHIQNEQIEREAFGGDVEF